MAKVTLGGEPVGRIKAGWILFTETWRFLMMDKELLVIPIVVGVLNIILFGLLVLAVVMFSGLAESDAASLAFLFVCYVVGAFTLSLAQAATANTVYVRARGGDATLLQSLSVAWSHAGSLLLWSMITATVGLLLRIISERSELLGKIVAALLGSAWAVLTYFVVPAMVISKHSAFGSIGTSARVFKQTWGESLVSNISYGLVFLGLYLVVLVPVGVLAYLAMSANVPVLLFVSIGLLVVWFVLMSLVASAMSGILRTLLYIYATEQSIPANFNQELLEKMLARKNPPQGGFVDPNMAPPAQPTA